MLRKFVWIQEELKQLCRGKSTEHHQKGCGHCSWLRKAGTFLSQCVFRSKRHSGEHQVQLPCSWWARGAQPGCAFALWHLWQHRQWWMPSAAHLCLTLRLTCLLLCFCPVLPRPLSWVRPQDSLLWVFCAISLVAFLLDPFPKPVPNRQQCLVV